MLARPSLLLPALSLWQREMVRFFRQPSRVSGSLATPFLFWLLFSSGYAPSFRPPGEGSADAVSWVYFFPGTVVLIILFTSIFSNISIIEDRREGFLQGVLVAPVPRTAIVLGKVLGGATIAFLEAVFLLVVARVGGLDLPLGEPVLALAAIALLAVSLAAIGFSFAWRLDSVQGFHAVMNFVLMPMWVLSGALFPASGTPDALRWLVAANPISYGLAMMRHGLGVAGPELPSAGISAAVAASFAAGTFLAAVGVASLRRRDGD
jgi:ABC-2 type transport system permease protein